LVILATTPAAAELTAKSILERLERGDPSEKLFLMGIGIGLSWANAGLNSGHKPLLFCVPEKVALTSEQELDILKRYVHENPASADFPVGGVLVSALIEAFPCR
jgi:hypothetical protein